MVFIYSTSKVFITDCFTSISVIAAEVVLNSDVSGTYYYYEMANDKPAYKHQFKDFYLFYAAWWKIEAPSNYKNAGAVGFINNQPSNENEGCPEEVEMGKWFYYESHLNHSQINMTEGKALYIFVSLAIKY